MKTLPEIASIPRLRSGAILYRQDPLVSGPPLLANFHTADKQKVCELQPLEFEILLRCDGTASIEQIAAHVGQSVADVHECISDWARRAPGMFEVVNDQSMQRELRHSEAALYLYSAWKARKEGDVGGGLAQYHRTGVDDAFEQFDAIETTISHLYREPHPALGGLSFGAALCKALLAECRVLPRSIVEIGGGTGIVAREFLNTFAQVSPDAYARLQYTIIDISNVLQDAQRRACAEHLAHMRFITADASELELESSADLVFANEMIADLPVALIDYRSRNVLQGNPDARTIVAQYQLNPPVDDGVAYLNIGAIRLLEKVLTHLNPEGVVVFTEYGSFDEAPGPVALKGHREFSIHFGHLQKVAAELGCDTKLESLGRFLGFDPEYEILDDRSFIALSRHLLPYLGAETLPRLAYDRQMLAAALGPLLGRVHNVQFTTVRNRGNLNPWSFFALRAKR